MPKTRYTNLLPLVSSEKELVINWQDLSSLVGNHSIIDAHGHLSLSTEEATTKFFLSYGLDPNDEDDRSFLSHCYQMALHYLHEELLPFERFRSIPEYYKTLSVSALLKESSHPPASGALPWACVLLKLLHCSIHVHTSVRPKLVATALESMKERINPVLQETEDGIWWIGDEDCRIPIVHFSYKEVKTFNRLMTKLLHKPGNLASSITDLIGIRFVTHSSYAAILLLRFLVSRHIVNAANILPERTKNSLAHVEEVKEWFDAVSPEVQVTEPEAIPDQVFTESQLNPHSAESFKMIKFVQRLHVKDAHGQRYFIPFEFQVLDKESWSDAQRGPGSHAAYRRRQVTSVRKRILEL